MAVRRPTFHELRIAALEPLCEDAVAVTFEVPDGLAEEFAFRPGQTLTLRRIVDGADERRSYSLCSPVGGPLRIAVREVPGGLFSRWLVREARVGEAVEVLPPTGLFSPELGEAAEHVLVAAGSGITPMLSIAGSVLDAHPGSRVTLLYGNRRSDTVMFADELADLKDRHLDRFQLVHVLSRETRDAELLSGRLDPDICLVYANPAQMILLINGLQWTGYRKLEWGAVGESACADSWGRALATGEPSLALPCFPERRYGGVPDDELLMALKPEHLAKALEGLAALARNGLRYPIPPYAVQSDVRAGMSVSYGRK